jgi:MFS family permease
VVLGLGTALGLPVGLSAAADDPRHAAGRVSVAASIGYIAFLAGPPVIGFLGDRVGVLRGLTVTAALLVVAMVASSATAPLAATTGRPAGR